MCQKAIFSNVSYFIKTTTTTTTTTTMYFALENVCTLFKDFKLSVIRGVMINKG